MTYTYLDDIAAMQKGTACRKYNLIVNYIILSLSSFPI